MANSKNMKPEDLIQGVNLKKHPLALQVAKECCWIVEKLEKHREGIADQPMVMPYDNGGGQKGIRKNPAYEIYNSTLSQLNSLVRTLDDMLADAKVEKSSSKLAELRKLSKEKLK